MSDFFNSLTEKARQRSKEIKTQQEAKSFKPTFVQRWTEMSVGDHIVKVGPIAYTDEKGVDRLELCLPVKVHFDIIVGTDSKTGKPIKFIFVCPEQTKRIDDKPSQFCKACATYRELKASGDPEDRKEAEQFYIAKDRSISLFNIVMGPDKDPTWTQEEIDKINAWAKEKQVDDSMLPRVGDTKWKTLNFGPMVEEGLMDAHTIETAEYEKWDDVPEEVKRKSYTFFTEEKGCRKLKLNRTGTGMNSKYTVSPLDRCNFPFVHKGKDVDVTDLNAIREAMPGLDDIYGFTNPEFIYAKLEDIKNAEGKYDVKRAKELMEAEIAGLLTSGDSNSNSDNDNDNTLNMPDPENDVPHLVTWGSVKHLTQNPNTETIIIESVEVPKGETLEQQPLCDCFQNTLIWSNGGGPCSDMNGYDPDDHETCATCLIHDACRLEWEARNKPTKKPGMGRGKESQKTSALRDKIAKMKKGNN